MAWPTTHFDMTCERTGVAHTVSVGLPVRHGSLDQVPLLLCLDGPWLFGTVLDATRIMSMSADAPEAVVVGLSFADDVMSEYLRQRARWYSPTPWVPPEVTGAKGVVAEECGRAADLLDFVRDQLLPIVEAGHVGGKPVAERWLIGHSFSALFGLRTLFNEPDLFDKWLLASPSIWWDDRAVLAHEQSWAEANDDLRADVFLSYGEIEGRTGPENPFRMGANVEELVSTLRKRGYPGLTLSHRMLPGDAHSSSIGAAISHGLRALNAS